MFNKRTILGIAIDTGCINIVKRNARGQLIKWAVEAVPDHLINQGMITSERELGLFIRQKLRESKIRGKKCAVCLSCDQIVVREFHFPAAIKDALMDNIRYEISEYLPLSIDNYVIDYRILDSSTTPEGTDIIRVMAVAVPKDIVDSWIKVFRQAGLKPVIIDIPANCQERWYSEYISSLEDTEDKNKNVLLIYMGVFSVRFTLLHEGIYYIDKVSSAVGSKNNEINMDLLLEETLEILNFYYARSPEHKISKIILIVDRKHKNILSKQIEQRTGISVCAVKMPVDDNNIISLPNAVGAVSKLEGKTKKRINLLKSNGKVTRRIYKLSAVLLTVLLGLGIGIKGFWIPVLNKYKILDEIKALEMEKDNYINVFNDYQKIKDEIEYLKNKKQQLDKVISNQKQLSYLLEVVDNCLPTNAYIIEFSTDDSSIRLFGTADNDNTVVEFLTALSSTGEFNRVFVNEIVLDQDTGLKLFSLQCDVDIYSDAAQENFGEN